MNQNKYNIICIPHFFYPIKGGVENMILALITYLAKNNHKCIVIHGGGEENKEYEKNNFDVKVFKTKNLFNNTYPIFGINFFKYVKKLIKDNPDSQIVIPCRHLTSSFLSSLICKILKREYYLIEYTADTSFVKSKIGQILVHIYEKTFSKFVVKNAKDIVVCSKSCITFLQNKFNVPNEKFKLIYNGINVEDFQNINVEKKENNIVFASKLIKVKDPYTTYKAFKNLSKKYPDWNFYFIGQGDLFIPQKTEEKNLKIINYLINREELFELLSKSKIYVNSSLSEGLSVTVIEACFFGSIAVLSDAPSNIEIAEVLDLKYFIFERQNQKDLEEKIEKAIEFSKDRMSFEKTHYLTKKFFNNEELFKKYERLFFKNQDFF